MNNNKDSEDYLVLRKVQSKPIALKEKWLKNLDLVWVIKLLYQRT